MIKRTALPFMFVIFIVVMLAGCAGPVIGPVDSPVFKQLVAKAIPKADEKMYYYGAGTWYQDARGFSALRSFSSKDPIWGVLVITKSSILFMQWDEPNQKLDVVKRLPFSEVVEVSLDVFGRSSLLVLHKKDLSYDSFGFLHEDGLVRDTIKNEEALKFLLNQIMPQKH